MQSFQCFICIYWVIGSFGMFNRGVFRRGSSTHASLGEISAINFEIFSLLLRASSILSIKLNTLLFTQRPFRNNTFDISIFLQRPFNMLSSRLSRAVSQSMSHHHCLKEMQDLININIEPNWFFICSFLELHPPLHVRQTLRADHSVLHLYDEMKAIQRLEDQSLALTWVSFPWWQAYNFDRMLIYPST